MAALAMLAAVGWFAGSSAFAEPNRDRPACRDCGRDTPTTHIRTLHPMLERTRYHDVSVARHVQRLRRVVTVTRVQPIFRIHDITRIHHRTIVVARDAPRRDLPSAGDAILAAAYACGCRP